MKPLRLTMQAFGSYGKETTIDFERPVQNLFLITGDTGAGKSTIFDAIVFALYGEASSLANRKEGVVLQSQFADYDLEPFVELTFSEGIAGRGAAAGSAAEGGVYTVRRVPRHLKTVTRGASRGSTREIGGSVSLILPDGTEYPSRETDRKLEEIVGLTRNQFMQVAMIAQGEFMELLRARSDDKKLIFRKLFHTELFQKIVEELNVRKKNKEKEIAVIRAQCQASAARVVIPEDYERKEMLEFSLDRIRKGELTELPSFLEEFTLLTDSVKGELDRASEEYREKSGARDEARDACVAGEHLLRFFRQLEQAQDELEKCASSRERVQEAELLTGQIRAAYEIQALYQRYQDMEAAVLQTREALEEQRGRLPVLIREAQEKEKKEEEAKACSDRELARRSAVLERVEKALALFQKIEDAGKDVKKKEKSMQAASREAVHIQESLRDLGARIREWSEALKGQAQLERCCALWDEENRRLSELGAEAGRLAEEEKDLKTLSQKAEKADADYLEAKRQFLFGQGEYERKRQDFLDARAGFLASQLEEGKPCPVCGSLEHPAPCSRKEGQEDISEELLETMGKDVERLRQRQEILAADAGSIRVRLEERRSAGRAALEKLWEQVKQYLSRSSGTGEASDAGAVGCPGSLEQILRMIREWQEDLGRRGNRLREERKALENMQKQLEAAEQRKERLQRQAEEAASQLTQAAAALESGRKLLQSLMEDREYGTREEVIAAGEKAKREAGEADLAYRKAREEADGARQARVHAEALIRRYVQELPGREEQKAVRLAEYRTMLQSKGLTEADWKKLTKEHDRSEADSLQEMTEEYRRRLAAAKALQKSAAEAVGDRERPQLEILRQKMENAEQEWKKAESLVEKYKGYVRENNKVYEELAPRMEKRRKIVEEHGRLDELYRLFSGNVSGSRMDLETYVQRYFLERILYAANRRFREMSAGQFELRMMDMENAGAGKNRGLDLMVYSAVTGREREVRTLSGGESFMAALSLALGMADQIQEHSSAVNLDMLFIDEGFGSLDEHSRDQAVKVLLEMAEGSRLIGIISHVTELKQEIDDQLIVSKDENGSHVRWQIS